MAEQNNNQVSCKACNKNIPSNSSFCPFCGVKVIQIQSDPIHTQFNELIQSLPENHSIEFHKVLIDIQTVHLSDAIENKELAELYAALIAEKYQIRTKISNNLDKILIWIYNIDISREFNFAYNNIDHITFYLSDLINFHKRRINETEEERIQRGADEMGVSVSTYLRVLKYEAEEKERREKEELERKRKEEEAEQRRQQYALKYQKQEKIKKIVYPIIAVLAVIGITILVITSSQNKIYNDQLRNMGTEEMDQKFTNVYADVISIEAVYNVYLNNYTFASDTVCKCKTIEGKTIWVSMDEDDWEKISANSDDDIVTYNRKTPMRLSGFINRADEVADNLDETLGDILVLIVEDFSQQ